MPQPLYACLFVVLQYCKYLHENMGYLRPVEQALKKFSEDLKDDSLTVLVSCAMQQYAFQHLMSEYFACNTYFFFHDGGCTVTVSSWVHSRIIPPPIMKELC